MDRNLIIRNQDSDRIGERLKISHVTAILGPRQVGKTTLAKLFQPDHIFDLKSIEFLTQNGVGRNSS